MRRCFHASHALCLVIPLLTATPAAQLPRTGLEWSTFLGGSGNETAASPQMVRIAGNGDVLVWLQTTSSNMPVTGAYQPSYGGGAGGFGDGYIARFTADGSSLVWATYLGGSGGDLILDAELDASGTLTVCGWTDSPDFVTTPGAYQPAPPSGIDGYVARFAWNGQQLQLVWSTLLGAAQEDSAQALALHPDGRVVVSGFTNSSGFPMAGASYQTTFGGQMDGFLAVLDATGSTLLASTFLGGSGTEFTWNWPPVAFLHLYLGTGLDLDSAGNPVVASFTNSTDFPTTPNAFQPGFGGGMVDGFITRLDIGLSQLTYSTYLGGSGDDYLYGNLHLGPNDRITVVGSTPSLNYPITPGAYQTVNNGGSNCLPAGDGVVTTLDTRQSGSNQLVWSTFLGGTQCEFLIGMAVDRCGRVVVAGQTNSANFPTTPGAFQPTFSGSFDAFVTRLDPSRQGMAQLSYSTLLGTGANPAILGVAVDQLGDVVVGGQTDTPGFPTTPGCFDPTYNGGYDAVVSKLSLLPQGVERFGSSTPACLHAIYQDVDSWPQQGNPLFALQAAGAPPSALGAVFFGAQLTSPVAMFNLDVWLGAIVPGQLVTADANGHAAFPLPVPAVIAAGTTIATQWAFLTSAQCPGTGVFSASEGLEITVQ